MARLLDDRFVAYDEVHGCDLATGEEVRLDALPARPAEPVPVLGEVLDDAREGEPRWIVADVRNGAQAVAMARRAAAAAAQRGFVPILVPLYVRLREALAEDLLERTLLLIGGCAGEPRVAATALLEAAAGSSRPHVLLTFRMVSEFARGCVVREARAAYGPARAGTARPRIPPLAADVARHLARASRAVEFRQAGRHAAAERLLREVAATLARRDAREASASVLVSLGRLLLERGRAPAADATFGDAAQAAGQDPMALHARLWQAAARTDAGRLTDAESICRAALLDQSLTGMRRTWAQALLVRVLCWQARVEEAGQLALPELDWSCGDLDAPVAASIDATAVRVLLLSGCAFEAGQRCRALLARADAAGDPLVRAIAATAHLRVLAASGDLHLAGERFRNARELARQARAPLRAARAALVWHDALRRAGRAREADRILRVLSRMRRAAPLQLARAIGVRLASGAAPDRREPAPASSQPPPIDRGAASLVALVYEEEGDGAALRLLIARLARDLIASRVDLVSADSGAVSALASAGSGLPTEIGSRVLEAGLDLSVESERGGRECGVPVRVRSRLVGALVCRWAIDRSPPATAGETLALAAALAAPRLDTLLAAKRDAAQASTLVPALLGVSAGMDEVRRAIQRAARAPFAVLLEGESGVGKELAARAIHQLSARRDRRFCDVNCAALPDELLESELFGHAKGAFTGALTDKAGLVEEADGGTLFLDEVADLSPRGQAKLLRVIQQQEVRRVGETFARPVDVRLVTAANRDMRRETAEHRFRSDLLYRLDVIRIRIPPLRERPEDVPVLAQHFWTAAAARVGSQAALGHDVLAALARHPWPGNVRELQNVLAALAVAGPARGRIRASLLPAAVTGAVPAPPGTLAEARAAFERRFVETALAHAGGSRTRAAAALGVSRQGLLKTMARLGIHAAGQ